MKILLYKDLIIKFLSQKIVDKNHQNQLKKIFDNEHSIWLYSKQFLLFLKEELSEEYEAEYQALVKKFSDYGENIKTKNNILSNDFDEEFMRIWNDATTNVVLTFAMEEPIIQLEQIKNLCILSRQQKNNYHDLGINIAILHPNKVSVSCHDFINNTAIDKYFDHIYFLARKITKVCIFDTQCNFDHKKFDYLIKNNIFVHYYTIYNRRDKQKNIENKQDLKRKFRACKMFTTDSKNAHGRRIIFENFIIHCDNDFWNLEVNASDWCIDVQYSKTEADKWLSRQSNYRE